MSSAVRRRVRIEYSPRGYILTHDKITKDRLPGLNVLCELFPARLAAALSDHGTHDPAVLQEAALQAVTQIIEEMARAHQHPLAVGQELTAKPH